MTDTIRAVLDDIAAERARQIAKWGVQHRADGTGGFGREDAAAGAKQACQAAEKHTPGGASWRLVLAEEVAEAFAETDVAKLRAELVQIAAVACAWVEDIDSREGVESVIVEDDPIHGYFGLGYSSYQVLPRVLLQSMQPGWQRKLVALLEEMRTAFAHVEQPECYDVQAAVEKEAEELTDAERALTGVTFDAGEGIEPDQWHDRNGNEIEGRTRVLVPVTDPLPPYRRGRTRVPRADQLPQPRSHTEPQKVVREDGTTATRFRVQRCCNGCGTSLGDVDDRDVAADGELTDVRVECPTCTPPRGLTVGEAIIALIPGAEGAGIKP